jgi:hypothetical protein
MTIITSPLIDQPRDLSSGQFGNKPQSAPDIRPLALDGLSQAQSDLRRTALLESGFVPASERVAPSHLRVESDDAGYPVIPDGGRRATYVGDGVTVTLRRSVTFIKQHAYNNFGTFDVPVTATYPGGTIEGMCRVTQNGLNEWSVQGVNFPGDAVQVAEAVRVVLESLKPRAALKEAGDLLAVRRARFAAAGQQIDPSPVESFVLGAGYDRARGVLAIKMAGRVYGYKASAERVRAFANSPGIGAAYNRLIKGTTTAQITECAKCHRFNVGGAVHRCPSKHTAPPVQRTRRTRAPK